ncbi:MAG: hypothetical protein ACREBN_09845, partial [Burkholderiaceae bacterium]
HQRSKGRAMIFDLPTFTLIHTVLSLVGIIAGLIVVGGLMAGQRFGGWTAAYLFTTVLTNVTGFFFPFSKVLPSHIVGVISLVVLVIAIAARYWKHLAGAWRTVFVVTAVLALYLNVFVLVVQLFQKFPILAALAPTQSEPAFVMTQGFVLLLFVGIGWAAVRGFRNERAA